MFTNDNKIKSPLRKGLEGVGLIALIGTGGAISTGIGATVAAAFLPGIMGSAIGGLSGEILDHIPYLNTAIPEGFAYLGNVFTDQNTIEEATKYLTGNLDKVGAGLGFSGAYFRSRTRVNVEKDN